MSDAYTVKTKQNRQKKPQRRRYQAFKLFLKGYFDGMRNTYIQWQTSPSMATIQTVDRPTRPVKQYKTPTKQFHLSSFSWSLKRCNKMGPCVCILTYQKQTRATASSPLNLGVTHHCYNLSTLSHLLVLLTIPMPFWICDLQLTHN